MKKVTNQFISEVAQQLMPYLLQANTQQDELDESSYGDMKYLFESNGATVIDLDAMLAEEEEYQCEI